MSFLVLIKEYIKRYPYVFIAAAIVITLFFGLSPIGSKIIELAPRPERDLPQSTLAGIVCQDYNRRPVAVMLANDPIARPLSGLSSAEIVFEMPVTPGGITRIMAVYQCNKPGEIGSIRSARDSFIGLALGLDAVFAHWGGETKALKKLNADIIDNIDALIYENSVYFRKREARPPHNGFTNYDKLYDKTIELGYDTTTDFKGYLHLKGREQIGDERMAVRVYETPHNVEWFYNEKTNSYDRFRAGLAEIDKNNNKQISAGVVIVMKATGTSDGVDYYDMNLIGQGNATVHQNGGEIKGQWVKEREFSPLIFLDLNGEEIKFKPGSIWVEITP